MIEVFFQYDFLQNALIAGILIGFIAPMLGVFLVVKRMSLVADALSHITLTGIAFHLMLANVFAVLSAYDPIFMGMVFAVIGALIIEQLRKVYTHFKEMAIPIILSGGVGLAVIFISLADGFNTDLYAYLFGSVAAVGQADLNTIIIITIIVVTLLILFYKEWFFISFDEEQASISGIRGRWLELLFAVLVALVIAAAMRIVGILLVSALMTLPVAAAMQWARSFKQMFFYSIVFGQIAVLTGIFLGFHLDLAPGGVIVVAAILLLVISFLKNKIRRF
ncbi:zinc ABC transporter, inner membrane permease protein ZnuB [Geomicrobium sp. JCM 19037]|uniref:metal ABC transporter permease n=1 Tax=unclassified Geomicrobium TaxID=2628951 RepID=UPI00045F459F|nr:metal ABC transporter permease [Geomicrobium sp. JCM 19037]GAK04202.1 zinc ABC transporter, inner membrane permease protein ZnuB [Geomicrobium sp. JCM 19037]